MNNYIPVKVKCVGKSNVTEEIVVFADGKMWIDGLSTKIEYFAKDEDFNRTQTVICVFKNEVTVTKNSNSPYTMLFKKGKSAQTSVNVDSMGCDILVHCTDFKISKDKNDMEILLDYQLLLQGGISLSDNQLKISIATVQDLEDFKSNNES